MMNYTKNTDPKTTIWKLESDGLTKQVYTFPGLPFGVLENGQVVHVPSYGQATCFGVERSGSGMNQSVLEIKLKIK